MTIQRACVPASAAALLLALTMALGACANVTPPPTAPKPVALLGLGGEAASVDGRWSVVRIDQAQPVVGSAPTVTFNNGRVNATTGCNGLMGSYQYSGQPKVLKVTRMAATMMACEPALMQQERLIASHLEQTVGATQPRPDAVVLHTADGRIMWLARAAAR